MPRNRNISIWPTKPNRKLMDSQRIAFLFSKEEYFSKSILDLVKRKKSMIKQEKWGVFFSHESTYWPCTGLISTITLYTRSTSGGWNNVWKSILILIHLHFLILSHSLFSVKAQVYENKDALLEIISTDCEYCKSTFPHHWGQTLHCISLSSTQPNSWVGGNVRVIRTTRLCI